MKNLLRKTGLGILVIATLALGLWLNMTPAVDDTVPCAIGYHNIHAKPGTESCVKN